MTLQIFDCLVITVMSLIMSSNAFWWRATSTEAPPTIKQIPLGYFRTYTYQPLAYPSGFGGYPFGWPQKPYTQPLLGGYKYDTLPVSGSLRGELLPSLQAQSSTPPTTTTTTTTTTTPAPAPSPPAPQLKPTPLITSSYGSKYSAHASYSQIQVPTYTRPFPQQQSNNFFRGGQPNSDYLTNYGQFPQLTSGQNQHQNIQFVPCMCPVNVNQPAQSFLENRSISEDDNEMNISEISETTSEKQEPIKEFPTKQSETVANTISSFVSN